MPSLNRAKTNNPDLSSVCVRESAWRVVHLISCSSSYLQIDQDTGLCDSCRKRGR